MSEPITYVGIDAHKVELHVALLAPDASAPVTWKVQNIVAGRGRQRCPAAGPTLSSGWTLETWHCPGNCGAHHV